MKIIGILILSFICTTVPARKIVIKSNVDRNSEYFKNKDFTFDQSKDDGKQPTVFKGDVMKSKTVVSENVQGRKNFKFALGTQNGIEIEQVGKLKDDNKTLVVKGSYSYTGADGRRYRVRYTADELGFHPITELEIDIPDMVKTTEDPNKYRKSNYPAKRYLPPSNTYLPPSNEYLPPRNLDTRGLEPPTNNV